MSAGTPGWKRQERLRTGAALLAVLMAIPAAHLAAQSADIEFQRGVEALHAFEYEDANAAFLRAQKADPAHALAYWGEAMTYHQTLWRNEDLAAGRDALTRLAANPAARRSAVATERGRALIDAVALLFGNADGETRRRRYAEAMAEVHRRFPGDPDVAAFHALALLGTMSRGLIGHAGPHEGHSAGLAGSGTQQEVGAILGRVLQMHPEHPGALHYLLHNYDDPAHAHLALDAARRYARVAQSSHARHMPAHIFLQLGLWEEAAASDRAAFEASDRWVAERGHPLALRSYHALAWLQYELLQLGRYREARATMDELAPLVKSGGDRVLLSDLASMRARQVVETRRWDDLATTREFANVHEVHAIGLSAARAGNLPLARLAREHLAGRAQAAEEGDLRPAIAIMEREVAALVELAEGRTDASIAILREAAQAEAQLPPPLGLPAPIKPAPELLGEVLLDAGRPGEAIAPFRATLARHANRSLAVLGLARATAAAGLMDEARHHYRTLRSTYSGADEDLPEVREAGAALAPVPPASSARVLAWTAAAGLVVLAGVGLAIRRRVAR